MIRVLHYGLSSHLGGIETYLYKLYSNVNRDEIKFDFLILGDEKPCYYNEFKDMGSTFYFVSSRRKNPIRNSYDVSKVLKNESFDLIHCHLNSLSYTVPVTKGLKYNYPVIVHSRNAGILSNKLSHFFHLLNKTKFPYNETIALSVSRKAGEWMFGEKHQFTTINNGVDIEKYRFDLDFRNSIRRELSLKENEKLILNVGALRGQKNHSFILKVFDEILKKDSNYKLMLVGEGSLEEKIGREIEELNLQDKVIFSGNRNDIPAVLSGADVFLFPSLYEGFPNAVLEAQTSGLPCIISSEISTEVMIRKNCIQISLEETEESWANKVIEIDKESERQFAAEDVDSKGFSVKAEVEKIEQIYYNIVTEKR